MKYTVWFLIGLLLILTGFYAGQTQSTQVQQEVFDSTAAPTPIVYFGEQSTLTDNPCELPCWFGLVPGKTTTEEAYRFIKSNLNNFGTDFNSEIDPKTKYVLNGAYRIFIGPDYRPDRQAAMDSFIAIKNGIVNYLSIYMNRVVTIEQVIQHLGLPDYIFFTRDQIDYLTFVYSKKLVRVEFYEPIKPPVDVCTSNTIGKTFLATTVKYYSAQSAYEPEWRPDQKIEMNGYENGETQPRLLAHSISFQQYSINPKQFETFLALKNDSSCEQLFQGLPEATAVPIPSLKPTPTPTRNPDDYFGVLPTFEKLMQDNGGCQLPCWWGFELGKTNEEDWYNFLHQQGFDKIRDDAPLRQHGTISGDTYFLSFGERNEYSPLDFYFLKKGILTGIHLELWNPNKWLSPNVRSITLGGLLAQLKNLNQTPEIYMFIGGTSSVLDLPFLIVADDVGVMAEYTFNIADTLPAPNDPKQWRYCLGLAQTTRIEITVQDPQMTPKVSARARDNKGWVRLEDLNVLRMDSNDFIQFFIDDPDKCFVPNFIKPEATMGS
ncbi:MAG: hypothetical protein GC179_30145 [Anaerolineaceae bacterium]|nr:hypothetical protein [Anaerolineaceae bacterium]